MHAREAKEKRCGKNSETEENRRTSECRGVQSGKPGERLGQHSHQPRLVFRHPTLESRKHRQDGEERSHDAAGGEDSHLPKTGQRRQRKRAVCGGSGKRCREERAGHAAAARLCGFSGSFEGKPMRRIVNRYADQRCAENEGNERERAEDGKGGAQCKREAEENGSGHQQEHDGTAEKRPSQCKDTDGREGADKGELALCAGSDRIGKERHAGRFDLDGSSAPHRILSGVLSVFERLRKMSFPGCRQVFVRGEKKHADGFSGRHRL